MTAAYAYYYVDEFRSKSNPKRDPYVVKIRLDNRLPHARGVQSAILTCACPGWTRRVQPDGSRSCRHVKACADDLRVWKASNGSLAVSRTPDGAHTPSAATGRHARFAFLEFADV